MTFRRATFEDGVFILRLFKDFFRKNCGVYNIPLDIDSSMNTIDAILRDGVFLVGESSYAGAMIAPCLWNYNYRIATVMLWGFKKPREIRIFQELARECKQDGATHIVASSHFPNNTIGRRYLKIGLREAETQYICKL